MKTLAKEPTTYSYADVQLVARANEKITKILKRLGQPQNFRVEITIENDNDTTIKYDIGGIFMGYPNHLRKSKIVLTPTTVNHIVGKHKLRKWDAIVSITFLHEYAHFLLFKDMSVKERAKANEKYQKSSYWRHKEETEAWTLTSKLIRKLGYHRSKTVREGLKKFVFPKGFRTNVRGY